MLAKIIGVVKKLASTAGTIAEGAKAVANPANQIQAVGGRRSWIFCVGIAFAVAAHYIGIPENIQTYVLGLGGLFVVGESARDIVESR